MGNIKRKHLWQGTGRDLVKQTRSPYEEELKPQAQIPEPRQISAELPPEKQHYNACSRKTFSVSQKWLVITCRFVVVFYCSWICVGCWKLRILEPKSSQAMNSNTLQPLNMSVSRPRPSLQGTGSQSLPWQWKQENRLPNTPPPPTQRGVASSRSTEALNHFTDWLVQEHEGI